jgi:hypothetical protein
MRRDEEPQYKELSPFEGGILLSLLAFGIIMRILGYI